VSDLDLKGLGEKSSTGGCSNEDPQKRAEKIAEEKRTMAKGQGMKSVPEYQKCSAIFVNPEKQR